jgi:hypothetical protein
LFYDKEESKQVLASFDDIPGGKRFGFCNGRRDASSASTPHPNAGRFKRHRQYVFGG